jgi:hypothetical protein
MIKNVFSFAIIMFQVLTKKIENIYDETIPTNIEKFFLVLNLNYCNSFSKI